MLKTKLEKNNIANQNFGFLTALYPVGTNSNKSIIWRCRCQCGKETDVSNADLLNGNTKSCGCQRTKSYGEIKIKTLLEENNILFEQEKTFNNCIFNDTGKKARFDFYLPKYNLLIEYDGVQHFKAGNGVFDNPEKFIKTQEHDIYKTEWCKNNNFKLVRIPYTYLDDITIKDLLPETSQFICI